MPAELQCPHHTTPILILHTVSMKCMVSQQHHSAGIIKIGYTVSIYLFILSSQFSFPSLSILPQWIILVSIHEAALLTCLVFLKIMVRFQG